MKSLGQRGERGVASSFLIPPALYNGAGKGRLFFRVHPPLPLQARVNIVQRVVSPIETCILGTIIHGSIWTFLWKARRDQQWIISFPRFPRGGEVSSFHHKVATFQPRLNVVYESVSFVNRQLEYCISVVYPREILRRLWWIKEYTKGRQRWIINYWIEDLENQMVHWYAYEMRIFSM